MIGDHSGYPDHKISWHIPAVVRHERQYQMEKAAIQLLPNLTKLEKLLGHNLAITESILKQRVAETVDQHVAKLKLNVVELAINEVDWEKLIHNSLYRKPPFDSGEKEKGFRDALIAESLLQLVAKSPTTPSVCRIVLVTNDKLLRQAAEQATLCTQNVRIVEDLDELKGLISTLVSQVGEDFIAEILPRAQSYFFAKDDKSSLYYREEVRKQINERFVAELAQKPAGCTETEDGTWYIGNARFVKKDRQRIFWASRVEPTIKAYRTDKSSSGVNSDMLGESATGPLSTLAGLLTSGGTAERVFVGDYGHVFEVEWSVTIGQHKKLSTGKVEDIRFIETRLRDVPK